MLKGAAIGGLIGGAAGYMGVGTPQTYVRLGLGVGVVAEMAVRDDPPGGDLAWRPVGHLFGPNTSRVAFKRGTYLRQFVFAFAELLSERLTRVLIERTLAERPGNEPVSYEL